MELYLDSVNLEEIKEGSKLGYLTGLTTTPTFMLREGIKDVDAQMLEIAKYVDILQVEALGDSVDEIVDEAKRLVSIGLDKTKTVFKIPISLDGTIACKRLTDEGFMVNLHLVYTVQQAYMAFRAGATYVCPLVGRLQDQGHDALGLVKECVEITQKYGYKSKIMFSSVRNVEHVKNALHIGVHTCTVPWKLMKKLTDNHFTAIGTNQFVVDTRLVTTKVEEVMKKEDVKISGNAKVIDAVLQMSKSKLGAVAVLDDNEAIYRIFTDGDLRRLIEQNGQDIHALKLSELEGQNPITIDAEATLQDAIDLCRERHVDNLIATNNGDFAGIVDIQDLI
ncbi:MAG: CBS domain-containing protein [Flavobacteriales bacterium]|nr:CBS domain-containing protein [Flavobacteriales bacterium]